MGRPKSKEPRVWIGCRVKRQTFDAIKARAKILACSDGKALDSLAEGWLTYPTPETKVAAVDPTSGTIPLKHLRKGEVVTPKKLDLALRRANLPNFLRK